MRYTAAALLLLVGIHALAQHNDRDSLKVVLSGHPAEDSARVDLLIDICRQEFFAGNKPEVLRLSKEALEISKKIQYVKGIGVAYNCLALYYQSIGDFDQVAENCMQMIEVYETSGNRTGLARAYSMLALVHQESKQFEKAEEYLKKALVINLRADHKPGVAVNYMNLGVTFAMQARYDSALDYFSKALAIRQQLGDEREIANAYTNLGNIYIQQKDFEKAVLNFNAAYPLAMRSNNPLSIFEINTGLIKIDTATGNYKKALLRAHEVLTLANTIHDKTRISDAYQLLTVIEQHLGNYQRAYEYLALSHAYSDSIFTEAKALQITELETRYESQKKEQTIQILNKDRKIHLMWMNILFIGLVLVILAGVAIYAWLRYRQKKNLEYLSIRIDLLTAQHQQLSEKYKDVITGSSGEEESLDQKFLRAALDTVEANISDSSFGVEKMADEMAMSRVSLHRRIKTITGLTPSDFLRSVRLKRAAALLRTNSDSVAQVGFSVGFEYQSYFSKAFKKQFGVSPSQYAAQHVMAE